MKSFAWPSFNTPTSKTASGNQRTSTLKQSASKGHRHHKRLPKDFSDKVLNLELEIDRGDFTMESVNKLVHLYKSAVEYYNGSSD